MFVKNYHAKEKLYHFKYRYRKIEYVGQNKPSPFFSNLKSCTAVWTIRFFVI